MRPGASSSPSRPARSPAQSALIAASPRASGRPSAPVAYGTASTVSAVSTPTYANEITAKGRSAGIAPGGSQPPRAARDRGGGGGKATAPATAARATWAAPTARKLAPQPK